MLMAAFMLTAAATDIKTQKGNVSVTFFSPDIVRVLKTTDGHQSRQSLVVTMKPQQVKVSQKDGGDNVTLASDKLVVTVDKATGRVEFKSPKGEFLLKEGEWQLTPITGGLDKGSDKVTSNFQLDRDEAVYGIGLMENNKLNQRGENRRMMQSNLEDFQNVFQSIKGYAFYWDNYSPTQLNDNSADGLTLTSEVGEGVDYYFMYGKTGDGNVALMRQLSGDAPMLPLWSYGFWQSRERYETQWELQEVVDKYRKLGIPLDGIFQDWQYWDTNYLWNAMEFLATGYPDPAGMVKHVHDQKARLAITIWQSFGPGTKPYRDLKPRNLLFDFETWPQSGAPGWPPRADYPSGVRVYKPYSAEARDIYWKHLTRLYNLGIDMWWMDSTDPDHSNYKESDLDVDAAISPKLGTLASFRSVRNAFPLECVRGVYEHQRATQDSAQANQTAQASNLNAQGNQRVMILTRSGYAGQQRYAGSVWTGDVRSDWQTLRNQVPMLLNFTLTGNPYICTDIGGFFSGVYNKSYSDRASGAQNPQFQELYTRWMQFGAFTPMMRSHGTETYRELYYYGKKGEPVYDALLDAINLRYRLLPYTYSTSWDVSHNRGSFMRALWMDFAADKRTHDMKDEYMFGRQILVAPILNAQYTQEKALTTDENSGWDKKEGATDAPTAASVDFTAQKTKNVYLPQGTRWYDFWTGKGYDGGQEITLQTTIKTIPLFVRAGGIVPVGGEMQTTADKDWSALELRVYPGADGRFSIYEDDDTTYNYEKGQYTEIPLVWNDRSRTLTIGRRTGQYNGMKTSRRFTVVLPDGTRKTVSYNGKKLSVRL